MAPVRVVHVHQHAPPERGGVADVLADLSRSNSSTEHVVLTANTGPRTRVDVFEGVRVVRAASFGHYFTPVCPTWPRWIRDLQPDIVHVHLPCPMAEAAALAARPRRLVVSLHNDYVRPRALRRLWWPVHRATLRSATRVITSSEDYASTSFALQGLKREALAFIPYGIDLTAWSRPHPEAASVRAAYPTPVVAFLGRLCYYKGLEVLVEAARHVSASFVIIGDGPWRERLERLSRDLRNVHLLGPLGESEAIDHLQAADVFAFPSTMRSEAFGLSQLKAMACGLPVVSSTLPGVAWLNRTGETGLTVPPGDASELAEALTLLLRDRSLRQRLSDGARKRAAEFSRERMQNAHHALYSACLAD